jgi:hypothetical protein
MSSPSSQLSVRWAPRATPLSALAVAGVGPVALALARRALATEDAGLSAWRGVAGAGVLVLLGDTERLPWVDGVVYLGRDAAAPSLLLPCNLAPDVAPSLLERALLARVPGGTPLAVLPGVEWLVPVGAARPVARETLAGWLAKAAGPGVGA